MKTRVLKINDLQRDVNIIEQASELIRAGQVVAFPTETVYGLGANALDPRAVEKIFKAKGRPGDNPLIVHVSKTRDVDRLISELPPKARVLMEAFGRDLLP